MNRRNTDVSNSSIFYLTILLRKEWKSIFYQIRSRNVCCELLNYSFITVVNFLGGQEVSLICLIETVRKK